jgi:hypothetical protein
MLLFPSKPICINNKVGIKHYGVTINVETVLDHHLKRLDVEGVVIHNEYFVAARHVVFGLFVVLS